MVKNKKIVLIIIIIVSILFLVIINLNKTKTLECKKILSNKSYNEKINVIINFSKKIKKYNINYKYNFEEGYMDNLVDKYDNIKKYLDYIDNNDGVSTNINQEGYTFNYKIDLDVDKVDKDDYKLLEIYEVTKLKNINEIKKHYENIGYICK